MNTETLLCFYLDQKRFALALGVVEKVIRAVTITPISDAGPIFYGVIDLYGELVPVINLRKRFGLASKPISIDDRFIIAYSGNRKIVLVVDAIDEVRKTTDSTLSQIELSFTKSQVKSLSNAGIEVVKFLHDENGIIHICEIEKLLGSDVELQIDQLLKVKQ